MGHGCHTELEPTAYSNLEPQIHNPCPQEQFRHEHTTALKVALGEISRGDLEACGILWGPIYVLTANPIYVTPIYIYV